MVMVAADAVAADAEAVAAGRFAPDVDGEVRIHPGSNGLSAAPGTMVPVRITAASVYDLEGEVVGLLQQLALLRLGQHQQ